MPRILLVDDNEAFLSAGRALLASHRREFLIDTALDGERALRAIRERDYDIVVSDVQLPGLNGLEVLVECRQIRPDTPVILITGYGDRELEEQAAKSGAYAFLHKPVAPEAFCAVIDRAALHTRSGRYREDVLRPDYHWYVSAVREIHRRSEAITAQLLRPLTGRDAEVNYRWAEEQADRIIETFLDHEGSDDLLILKEQITRALCHAYRSGKMWTSATHGFGGKTDFGPDLLSYP